MTPAKHKSDRSALLQRRGALLAETVMAIAILTAVMIPTGMMLGNAVRSSDLANRKLNASLLGESLLTEFVTLLTETPQLPIPSSEEGLSSDTPNCFWKRTSVRDPNTDGVRVTVEVSFRTDRVPEFSLTRIIALPAE